ncbi:hypothetical protein [Chitinophaga parva]|uniref:hypothetical protein n=1 Tax=Chitinophaga parva TaxID=2169414 RepID=UPI00105744A5|nr:hypothetical protein [Chitinophaga parva]
MKKVLYSALALAAAIGGVAATKANTHRVATYYFKLIPSASTSVQHDVTLTTNWTLTNATPSCSGTAQACTLGSNTAPTVSGVRHLPTIPSLKKITAVTGAPGRFVVQIDATANVDDAKAKAL